MDLKKSYSEKYGCEKIVTDRNSALAYAELDMLKLAEGEEFSFDEEGKEFALVVLCGSCEVYGKDFRFEKAGVRKSVFEGVGEAVYVGKDTPFTVKAAAGGVKIAVCKAPARKYYAPQLVKTENIRTKDLGKGAYSRKAAFNVAENVQANLLYIGEFWVEDGNWASFPPHKHDVEHMPEEGALDEIYYYEFDKPSGFGVQMVYSKEGDLNEAYKVNTGDLVEIPKGYHPFSVAPGYKNYCLWIMAGPDRGIFCTTEEGQKWMLGK